MYMRSVSERTWHHSRFAFQVWRNGSNLKVSKSIQFNRSSSNAMHQARHPTPAWLSDSSTNNDKDAELQHGKLLTSVTLCTMTKPTCAQHTWLFWVFVLVARETFALPALSASCAQYQISRHGTCVPAKTSG